MTLNHGRDSCACPRKGLGEGEAWGTRASNRIRAPGPVADSCPGWAGGDEGSLMAQGPGLP